MSVRIVDGAGAAVNEQVCELGSTVALRCEVRGLKMEGGPSLLWYRKKDLLNDDTTRGGIRYLASYYWNIIKNRCLKNVYTTHLQLGM